jgi:hypothetical protein
MSLYRTSAGEMEWDTTQPLQITLVLQRDGLVWHIPAVLELERLDAEPVKPRELRTDPRCSKPSINWRRGGYRSR